MSTSVCQSDPRCSNDSGDRKSSGSGGKAAFTTACAAVWRNVTVLCADLIAFQALAKARSPGEVVFGFFGLRSVCIMPSRWIRVWDDIPGTYIYIMRAKSCSCIVTGGWFSE